MLCPPVSKAAPASSHAFAVFQSKSRQRCAHCALARDTERVKHAGNAEYPDERTEDGHGEKGKACPKQNHMTILTVEQVAARYSVEPSTVREWARTGAKPAFKVGGRLWRFTLAALNKHDRRNAPKLPAICGKTGMVLGYVPTFVGPVQPVVTRPPRVQRDITWQSIRGRRLRQATPRWANRAAIAAIYSQARKLTKRTGIPHQVDHIVPLQGRSVCGLHVESNLRVISKAENMHKSNSHSE